MVREGGQRAHWSVPVPAEWQANEGGVSSNHTQCPVWVGSGRGWERVVCEWELVKEGRRSLWSRVVEDEGGGVRGRGGGCG